MTTQLPSKERLAHIANFHRAMTLPPSHHEIEALASFALAAYEQEPVAKVVSKLGDPEAFGERDLEVLVDIQKLPYNTPFFAHPAPSIPTMPADLHPDTQKLVADFSTALAEKLYKAQLKYGYSDNWKQGDWSEQCLQHLQQHIGKGDPRDVAAYCAFMWFHGWKTELPAPSIPAAVPESVDSREIFEKWCTTNLERNKWHPEFYAHLPAREQWAAWEAGRAAMLQSEPVSQLYKLPDGYCVMPSKLSAENGAKGALSGDFHVTHRIVCQSCGGEGCEDCNEEGGWDGEILIGWDIIKQIHEASVEACALPASPKGV